MALNQKLTHVIAGRTVDKARQENDVLHIDFSDGSSMQVQMSGPTSAVMVRDRDGKLEYAD